MPIIHLHHNNNNLMFKCKAFIYLLVFCNVLINSVTQRKPRRPLPLQVESLQYTILILIGTGRGATITA